MEESQLRINKDDSNIETTNPDQPTLPKGDKDSAILTQPSQQTIPTLSTQNAQSNLPESEFESNIYQSYKEKKDDTVSLKFLQSALDTLQSHITTAINSKIPIITNKSLEIMKRISIREDIKYSVILCKIYYKLISDPKNYNSLTNSIQTLILFCNEIIKINEQISSLNFVFDFKVKTIELVRFIIYKKQMELDSDQKEEILNLLGDLPEKFYSESYIKFMNNVKANKINFENFQSINDYFVNTLCIEEQYEMLKKFPVDLGYEKEDFYSTYKYGLFYLNFLFYNDYLIINEYSDYINFLNKESESQNYTIIDLQQNVKLFLQNKSFNKINIENFQKKKFIICPVFKSLINNNKFISHLLKIIINYINQCVNYFKNDFNLQFCLFSLIKKIILCYKSYIDINFMSTFEEIILINYMNLVKLFSTDLKRDNENYNNFSYIFSNDLKGEIFNFYSYLYNENIMHLKSNLRSKKEINSFYDNTYNYDKNEIRNQPFSLQRLNIAPIGTSCKEIVEPGKINCHFINVEQSNTLIFLEYKLDYDDITINIYKNDNGKLVHLFNKEKINCEAKPLKICIFCSQPTLYKIDLDNSYSWINQKIVRFRYLLLKSCDDIKCDIKEDEKEGEDKEHELNNADKFIYCYFEKKYYTFNIDRIQRCIKEYNSESKEIVKDDQGIKDKNDKVKNINILNYEDEFCILNQDSQSQVENKINDPPKEIKEEPKNEPQNIPECEPKSEPEKCKPENVPEDKQENEQKNENKDEPKIDTNEKIEQEQPKENPKIETPTQKVIHKNPEHSKLDIFLTNKFFENLIIKEVISRTENFKSIPTVNLNILLLHSVDLFSQYQSIDELIELFNKDTLNYTPDTLITDTISKIGFYPYSLLNIYDNIKFKCVYLAEHLVLYHYYLSKVKTNYANEGICLMLFYKNNMQIAYFNEGGIFHKINEIDTENLGNLIENLNSVDSLVDEVNDYFDEGEIVCVFADNVDQELKKKFLEVFCKKCSSTEPAIKNFIYENDFIEDAVKYFSIFFDENNYKINEYH